jgi:hypothetical protein
LREGRHALGASYAPRREAFAHAKRAGPLATGHCGNAIAAAFVGAALEHYGEAIQTAFTAAFSLTPGCPGTAPDTPLARERGESLRLQTPFSNYGGLMLQNLQSHLFRTVSCRPAPQIMVGCWPLLVAIGYRGARKLL